MNYLKTEKGLERTDKPASYGIERVSASYWFSEQGPEFLLKARTDLKKVVNGITPEEEKEFQSVLDGISEERWKEWEDMYTKKKKVVKKKVIKKEE